MPIIGMSQAGERQLTGFGLMFTTALKTVTIRAGAALAGATGSGNRVISSLVFISYSLRRPTDISDITRDVRCHLPSGAMARAYYSVSAVSKCQDAQESPPMLF